MTQLGKYELHEQLGRGGFGTVYRAIDTSLGREVALKVLHPQLTTDPDFLERFRNEARLVAALDSPHIVTIHDLGEADGHVFVAMKYLLGGNLKQKLEQHGALPFDESLNIMKQVCEGLETAHDQGLVHRDIKPANILFDQKGRAVLGDFGLARAIQQSSTTAASSTGGVGTPAYRAPELWIGKPPASSATDIYSLGCVFSEMLTGKTLFEGVTTEEILARHLNLGPSLPEVYPVGVPIGIREIVEKAVTKDVKNRYQTIMEFESGFTNCLKNGELEEEQTTNGDHQKTEGLLKNKIRWYMSGGLFLITLALFIYGFSVWFPLKPTMVPTIVTVSPTKAIVNTTTSIFTPTIQQTVTKTIPPTSEIATSVTELFDYVNANSNCRYGPGTGYTVIKLLTEGTKVNILGAVSDNSWVNLLIDPVELSNGRTLNNCWVSSSSMGDGNIKNIEIIFTPAPIIKKFKITVYWSTGTTFVDYSYDSETSIRAFYQSYCEKINKQWLDPNGCKYTISPPIYSDEIFIK